MGALAAALLLPAEASAMEISPSSPSLGQYVVVTATVSSKPGSEIYDPAVFVDWDGGACPGGAAAARTAAKGHFRRGLGFAPEPANSFSNGTVAVSATVLMETTRQRICIYDVAGALSDSALMTVTPKFPPQGAKGPASRWGLNGFTRRYAVQTSFKGLQPAAARGVSKVGTFGCDTKRFYLNASKIHLDAAGHFSYNAPVAADNSNNYDAPIPLKFRGRATLKLHGTVTVGAQELKAPVMDRAEQQGVIPKGRWGKPVIKAKGTFSAPGYRVQASTSPCSGSVSLTLNPFIASEPDPAGVMPGQGSARMATDPKHPNQPSPDEAGKGEPVPAY
jgi:hypothetical protein